MKQKKLPDGTPVPAIWQGGAKVTNADPATQIKVWREGVRFGCNAIDTAASYGNGKSEMMVGEVIKIVGRNNIFVSSKVPTTMMRYAEVLESCHKSLKRLGTDYIDLYQIHWGNPEIPFEETLGAMMQLRNEGKIRYIGVSNLTPDQTLECDLILNGKLAAIQMEYNLVNRAYERDLIPFCNESGKLFMAYSPLNSGNFLYADGILKKLALKYRRTTTQLVLNWLTMKHNVSALPKASTMQHMIENAQSTEFTLDEEDYQAISKSINYRIAKLKPKDIQCVKSGGTGEMPYETYKTVEEAIENRFNLIPSPVVLSKELKETKCLTKLPHIEIHNGEYHLVDGNVRYWAWRLAFGDEEEIECIITKE